MRSFTVFYGVVTQLGGQLEPRPTAAVPFAVFIAQLWPLPTVASEVMLHSTQEPISCV